METLTLYQFPHCPYCAKVRAWLDEHNVQYEKVNVESDRDDPERKELLEKSGVTTVPVLKAGEEYIGESDAIITWLKENKN